MANYTPFTKTDFETALAAAIRRIVDARGLEDVRIKRVTEGQRRDKQEYAYRIITGRGRLAIKVYSSVSPINDRSRDLAADAIRLTILDEIEPEAKPLTKKGEVSRVYRTEKWSQNLEKRLNTLFDVVDGVVFCTCGSPKVDRNGANGPFKGCLNWYEFHAKGQRA